MKISQLVDELQKFKDLHGDIEVYHADVDYGALKVNVLQYLDYLPLCENYGSDKPILVLRIDDF